MSRLFQLAARLARGATRGHVEQRLRGQKAERLLSDIVGGLSEDGAAAHSNDTSRAVSDLLSLLGPLGDAVRAAIGAGRSRSLGRSQLAAALDVLGLNRSRGRKPTEVPVARDIAESLQEVINPPPGKRPPPLPKRPPPLPSGGKRPPPLPPSVGGLADDDEPPEHDIELSGRGTLGYDAAGTPGLISREILTPGSSNVYSFVFEQENQTSGILYVTFKAWHPGQKGKRPNTAGPTYAYYDVPVRRYEAFASMAATTAGGAVWEFLRVRGSKWDHRFPYRLVAGVLIPSGGQYVPRKATRRGFKKRALANQGTGRRGFVESSLPEQSYDARPNRGRPNRGRPDRGTPNRGR